MNFFNDEKHNDRIPGIITVGGAGSSVGSRILASHVLESRLKYGERSENANQFEAYILDAYANQVTHVANQLDQLGVGDLVHSFVIGTELANGLGSQHMPEYGKKLIEGSMDLIDQILERHNKFIIVMGTGKGFGLGAGEVICQRAYNANKFFIPVCIRPSITYKEVNVSRNEYIDHVIMDGLFASQEIRPIVVKNSWMWMLLEKIRFQDDTDWDELGGLSKEQLREKLRHCLGNSALELKDLDHLSTQETYMLLDYFIGRSIGGLFSILNSLSLGEKIEIDDSDIQAAFMGSGNLIMGGTTFKLPPQNSKEDLIKFFTHQIQLCSAEFGFSFNEIPSKTIMLLEGIPASFIPTIKGLVHQIVAKGSADHDLSSIYRPLPIGQNNDLGSISLAIFENCLPARGKRKIILPNGALIKWVDPRIIMNPGFCQEVVQKLSTEDQPGHDNVVIMLKNTRTIAAETDKPATVVAISKKEVSTEPDQNSASQAKIQETKAQEGQNKTPSQETHEPDQDIAAPTIESQIDKEVTLEKKEIKFGIRSFNHLIETANLNPTDQNEAEEWRIAIAILGDKDPNGMAVNFDDITSRLNIISMLKDRQAISNPWLAKMRVVVNNNINTVKDPETRKRLADLFDSPKLANPEGTLRSIRNRTKKFFHRKT